MGWSAAFSSQLGTLRFVDLSLVNAYRRRKLESACFIVSHRVAANGVVVRRVERLRRFPSPDVLLRMLMLYVAHGPLSIFQGSNLVHQISTPAAPFRMLPSPLDWVR
jgi:hypothetical protein